MSSPPPADTTKARFTTGSTMRHVVVMCTTGSIGLVAIFLVDFANLFYISLLGDPTLTAAIGFAGIALYFHMSFCIGLMIATVALTSRALGAGDRERARRVAASALVIVAVVTTILTIVSLPLIDWLLDIVGAEGEAHRVAAGFMLITLPTTPLFGVGMSLVGILRAAGDAKRSMYATLVLGLTTAILDPILIYGLDYGVTGAAVVMVLARVLLVVYALTVAIKTHNLIGRPTVAKAINDFAPLAHIGGPAVLANIATPVGNGIVTAQIAEFGDNAVAGWTIVARLIPVAFGVLFALPGAVGPIVGQNFGAQAFDRVRRTITDAMILTTAYTLIVSSILFVAREPIVGFFGATGDDARLVLFFCQYLAITYIFGGGLFVSVAAFNNLGYPLRAMLFNWGRATIGTIPFVWAGAYVGGAEGAMAGFALGAVPFGILGLFALNRTIDHLAGESRPSPEGGLLHPGRSTVSDTPPASSGKAD